MAGTPSIEVRVGARIRELREAQGMSQRDLATAIGMARSLVAYVEQGTKAPTISTLDAIAMALGVTVSELTAEKPEKGATRKNEPTEAVPENCRRLVALLRTRGPEYVATLEKVVKLMDDFAKARGSTRS